MDTENNKQAEQRRNKESDPEITDRIRASRTVASRMTQAFESPAPSTEPMPAYSALLIGQGRRTGTLDFNGESGVAVRAIATGVFCK